MLAKIANTLINHLININIKFKLRIKDILMIIIKHFIKSIENKL